MFSSPTMLQNHSRSCFVCGHSNSQSKSFCCWAVNQPQHHYKLCPPWLCPVGRPGSISGSTWREWSALEGEERGKWYTTKPKPKNQALSLRVLTPTAISRVLQQHSRVQDKWELMEQGSSSAKTYSACKIYLSEHQARLFQPIYSLLHACPDNISLQIPLSLLSLSCIL